ncbi:uncharacterized protein bcl3 [Aplochiton taeniatus]
MTMNGHQTVTTAPLDLRTTTRERGAAADSIPTHRTGSRDSHFAAEMTVDSPPEQQRTDADCPGKCLTTLDIGNPEILDTKHLPNCAVGSETGSRQRRATDKSSSKLPFRKRQFPIEGDITGQSATPPENGNRLSPTKTTDMSRQCILPKVFKTDDIDKMGFRVPISHRCSPTGGFEKDKDGYQVQAFQPYCHPPGYSVYHWPHLIQIPRPLSPLHQPQPAEQLLAAVALATHQDDDGDTALHIAVARGEEELVLRLIDLLVLAKKDLDIYNNLRQTPLHLAVITDQASLVGALLSAAADPAALDRNGQTAVHLCCEHDQRNCLSVVLSHPPSSSSSPCLEIRNYEGLTPLHLAVQGGRKCLVRMLLDAGADINAMDVKSGQRPLTHAVESNNTEMVHFLIENGCNVNGQSYSGNTALHSACGRGQVDTVRLLLRNGADSSIKNYHNDTPIMVAKNKKVTDVLRGRDSKHSKAPEQNAAVASPRVGTQHPQSRTPGEKTHAQGSPSPSRNLERSPSTTPHTSHHSASQSPRGAVPPFSPRSESTESLLGRKSPMDTQLSRRSSSNMIGVDIRLDQTGALPYPMYVSPLHHAPYSESTRGALLAGHAALCPPIAHGAFYTEHPFILLPSNGPYPALSVSRMAIDSRPASRCSNQSDTSTMSISSGGKGDS